MSYFRCPYCEEELDEPDECNDPSEQYEHECTKCGKNFVFTVEYSKDYSEDKADCLNGAPHDYQEIKGFPVEHFKHRRRCSMCSKEITLKESGL